MNSEDNADSWTCVGCGLPFTGEPAQTVNAYDETEYACSACAEIQETRIK